MKYKRIIAAKNGQEMFYNYQDNGRPQRTGKDRIPAAALEALMSLEPGTMYDSTVNEVVVTPVKEEKSQKICIFCGEPGTCTKYVYLQTVYLCDEDYHSKTTGEVGQYLRERDNSHVQEEKETVNA